MQHLLCCKALEDIKKYTQLEKISENFKQICHISVPLYQFKSIHHNQIMVNTSA